MFLWLFDSTQNEEISANLVTMLIHSVSELSVASATVSVFIHKNIGGVCASLDTFFFPSLHTNTNTNTNYAPKALIERKQA